MQSNLKQFLQTVLKRAGYRVARWRPQNRFQAMEETLLRLKVTGYSPNIVIDAGANMGQWTLLAQPIFPNAAFHLIEPQAVCIEYLQQLVETLHNAKVHAMAVTQPGVHQVKMYGGSPDGGGTGAFVALPGENPTDQGMIICPATTLDELFAGEVERNDRTLLKMDLESHELRALQGATRLLKSVEVVLTELSFYEVDCDTRPTFRDYLAFLNDAGFELYDFACLSPRSRDQRLRQGDVLFVRRDSPLLADNTWG